VLVVSSVSVAMLYCLCVSMSPVVRAAGKPDNGKAQERSVSERAKTQRKKQSKGQQRCARAPAKGKRTGQGEGGMRCRRTVIGVRDRASAVSVVVR
jgi:hypothetical protein